MQKSNMNENKKWIIFSFSTNHESAYAIEQFLQMQGAEGITVEDKADFLKTFEEQKRPDVIIADYLENLSFDVKIEAYFLFENNQLQVNKDPLITEFGQINSEKWISISEFEQIIKNTLENIAEISPIGKGYLSYRILQNEDWQNNWKEYYKTQKFGRIIINPSWIDYEANDDEIVLNLDPGSAFGTGTHESTSLILKILSEFDQIDLPGKNILDLGTGSGILAITAKKIFTDSQITAIDIDEHAIEVARENAVKNNCKIHFETAELKDLNQKYDLILANLIAAIHLDLSSLYTEKLNENGLLIVSGIIASREAEVKQAFKQQNLKLIEEYHENDWAALIFRKNQQ